MGSRRSLPEWRNLASRFRRISCEGGPGVVRRSSQPGGAVPVDHVAPHGSRRAPIADNRVAPEETLIRHIHPSQWPPDLDRPMATAFRDERLSVDREVLRSVEVCCGLRPDWGFSVFSAETAMGLHLSVEAHPLGSDGVLPHLTEPSLAYNPAHALVLGHKSKLTFHRLRDASWHLFRPGTCRGS